MTGNFIAWKSPDRKCNCKACHTLLNIFIPLIIIIIIGTINNNYLVYHYVPSYSEGLQFAHFQSNREFSSVSAISA